ncbi:Oxysterol-binding protein-domain-containing protein [Scheffersomyces xylosifermentans]|uniref:Oxysterol-binding protein-domain-containing protein n=1 Tax=Scheffersomyces xylosifermentans TaxID=1304137 RepID=UPI00315D5B26
MAVLLNASLLRLKLLDALRSGETSKVDTIIQELTATKATTSTTDLIQLKETILHYAVQVAPLSVIQYLVTNAEKYDIDINSQDPDGNTPLHLAAVSSRIEVVKYLLSLPDINDTIVNLKKQQPVEMCKDLNIAQLMQFERAKFVEKVAGLLRQNFSNRDFDSLEKLLVLNPRASELLDINGADPDTGNTVLHEFIKKDDVEMCDWILKHGGDPFKRDKRGKLPADLIQNKNDQLKKIIKVASKEQNIMDPVINTSNAIRTGSAPTYKGYLRKWTNFASGYKLRYFVLDANGILSYYTNQDDTYNACRGSLNLGYATLHLDSSEKLKFEIIGKNGIRWHLKANHPIETNRWVWTLQNSITIAKDNIKRRTRTSIQEEQIHHESASEQASLSRQSEDQQSQSSQTEKKRRHLRLPGRKHKHKRSSSQASTGSQSSINESFDDSLHSPSRSSTFKKSQNLGKIKESKLLNGLSPRSDSQNRFSSEDQYSYADSDADNFDFDIRDIEGAEYGSENETSSEGNITPTVDHVSGPLGEQVFTVRRSLQLEISSLLDLFTQAVAATSSTGSLESGDKDVASAQISHNANEVAQVGLTTLRTIQELFTKYISIVQVRDAKIGKKLDRQLEINKLWETSIHQLEEEIRQREAKLAEFEGQKKQLKKYFSSGAVGPVSKSGNVTPGAKDFGPGGIIGISTDTTSNKAKTQDYLEEPLKPQLAPIPDPHQILGEILHDDSEDEFFDADEFDEDEEEEQEEEGKAETEDIGQEKEIFTEDKVAPLVTESSEPEKEDKELITDDISESTAVAAESVSKEKTVSEKEPISEIETANLNDVQGIVAKKIASEGSFLGYENPPRTKLSMDEDNRPKVGLWGILKSMIGKDMTRMALPVSFNEPTSLLQRLAEDIEYCNLLDTAATYKDSTLRLIYVAAFAASEYSSTIDRVAKPFNPLLGETFEYCRPDQNYRLIVEQVSHHPPISACSAESPKWDYYGENAVDSSFRGRSFDFKHLGKMFCTLRPDHGVIDSNNNQVAEELYSWKKVNTSVVGIMIGNPTVDNFGLMVVRNHTTGDSITVDLKQRGWRASSAYQLSGQALDRNGKAQWAIGGRWSSKIFAKKILDTTPRDSNRRNSLLEEPNVNFSNDPFSGNKFLVWQAAPRKTVPFNLTTFAITLNGLDDNLKPWLAPTDTRLRPDQRAMEEGRYDEASDEKHRVEVKQRAARKQREDNRITYVPNWFVKKEHPVTGDAFWEFKGEYWQLRKEHKLSDSGDIF